MQLSSRTSRTNGEHTTDPKRAKALQRLAQFEDATAQIEAAFAEDSFSIAFGAFREALNLSRGFPSLEERIVKLAVAEAAKRLPRDWRMAKLLLLEASELDPGGEVPPELLEEIQQCEQKETVDRALKAAEAASATGTNKLARQRLAALAAQYPGDPRLENRPKGKATPAAKPLSNRDRPPERAKPASAQKDNRSVLLSIRARAREFEKSGLYDEAIEQWEELSKIDPSYPGLKEEIERCRRQIEKEHVVAPSLALVPFTPAAARPDPWLKSKVSWNKVAALSCSAVLLSVAADLVWMQYAKSPVKPKATRTKALLVNPPVEPTTTPHADTPPPIVAVIPSPPPPPDAKATALPDASSGATASVAPAAVAPAAVAPAAGATIAEVPKRKTFDSSRLTAPLAKLPPSGVPSSATETGETPPLIAPPTPDSLPSVAAPQLPEFENRNKPEMDAWASVNQTDQHSVETYLSRFPGGANHQIAEQVLTNLRRLEAERTQSAEVLYVLRQYAAAWNARNVEGILSLESYLDRRTVKAQLSPLKSIVMSLSPIAEPQFEGDKAKVLCRRRVSQIFADNVEKQSPEVTVTFVLAKRNGIWIIESATQ